MEVKENIKLYNVYCQKKYICHISNIIWYHYNTTYHQVRIYRSIFWFSFVIISCHFMMGDQVSPGSCE